MFTEEEKNILKPYVSSTDENVFAIKNLGGVVGAVYARYSRAKGGFRETLLKEFIKEGNIDPKHADELIARVLVAYGDDSVGELEGAHVSFEKVTMLAAKEIEDHRIGGSPIEQSTRYVFYDQKDENGKWLYYLDDNIMNAPYGKQYVETMDFIFQTYADLVEPMKKYFEKLKPIEDAEYDINGDGVKEKLADLTDEKLQKAFKTTYNFDLRSKACDTLRALLPIATLTNVGMFANGRFYQTLISNLLSTNIPELKKIANQTTQALADLIPQYVRRARVDEYWMQNQKNMFGLAQELFGNERDVPATLPNYELMSRITKKPSANDLAPENVENFLQENMDIDQIAAMIYPYTELSLKTLRERVAGMPLEQKNKIIQTYTGERKNRRNRPGRALESGYPYCFDTVINFGTYKDLQRHRMNTQQRQLFTTKLGFYVAEELVLAGYENKILECVKKTDELYDAMAKIDKEVAQYAAMHGHYIRWSISMNDKEAMHLLELRTTPQGHPNYRAAGQEMHKLIMERSKWRAELMKFVDYEDYYWSRADSEAKQRVKEAELDKKYGKES